MDLAKINEAENEERMLKGELYYAFTPELLERRRLCAERVKRFNNAEEEPRRVQIELVNEIIQDKTPLPPARASEEEDVLILKNEPYVQGPVRFDYGYNVKLGKGVYINSGATFIDTCLITLGARTMLGPNCSFFSGCHPLDPFLRNGLNGPEMGKPITIGEDCWLGGNVTVLPGVTIGRGATVGAASVVTKDVPAFHVVAGNPARVIRKIEPKERDPREVDGVVADQAAIAAASADH